MPTKNSKLIAPFLTLGLLLLSCEENDLTQDASCIEAAKLKYPEQSSALYVLPFSVGERYQIGQGNCTFKSHQSANNQQYAYDIMMPMGTSISTVRAGQTIAVETSHRDNTGEPGQENYIVIEHADGSASRYIHLMENGALVAVGEDVAQGQAIAASGNSGNSTGPHLHFDVMDGACIPNIHATCESIAVNFKNTSSHMYGLVEGAWYTAEPF